MDIPKRILFLANVIQKTDLGAERPNAGLRRLNHTKTLKLAHKMVTCSMAVFSHYINILSIGQATAIRERKLSFVVSDVHTATTIEKDSEASPHQIFDESRSKTCTNEPDILLKKGKPNPSAFPPPVDALRPAVVTASPACARFTSRAIPNNAAAFSPQCIRARKNLPRCREP